MFDAKMWKSKRQPGCCTFFGHAFEEEVHIRETCNRSIRMSNTTLDGGPADAQKALLCIAWGIAPVPQFGWRALPEACKREDWMKAADECRIKGAPDGRNRGHKLMFQNAHYVKENNSAISKLWWPSQLVQKTVVRA